VEPLEEVSNEEQLATDKHRSSQIRSDGSVRSVFICGYLRSPFHAALFGRVDFSLSCHGQRLSKEVSLDVVEKKVLRVGIGKIQTIVIDDLSLLLQPTTPAGLTDLRGNLLAQLIGKGRKAQPRTLFTTVFAFYFRHERILLVAGIIALERATDHSTVNGLMLQNPVGTLENSDMFAFTVSIVSYLAT
jgi:hypothetical protein